MVVSKIDNTINYSEQKKLNPEDIEHNATTYETDIFSMDVIIAIGKEKYTFIEKEVIYFPLYLIKDDLVYSQIGLYELKSDHLVGVLDDDGDLNIDQVGDPLLYSFVSDTYLKKILQAEAEELSKKSITIRNVSSEGEGEGEYINDPDDPDDPDDPSKHSDTKSPTLKINKATIESLSKGEGDSGSDEIFKTDPTKHVETITKTDDTEEVVSDKAPWIQQYMKSTHFGIQDNEGGGDCLFAVIRDAFNSIGKETTVNKLRDILSREANDEIFTMYKEHYDMYASASADTNMAMTKLSTTNKKLKKELSSSKSRTRQIEIVEEGKTILEKYNRMKEEQKLTQELKNEFEFMKGVDNLEEFKAKLRTCEFWAETWAISTLERVLNIKLILLSHESFVQGDIDNVIQCGQLNDAILEKRGVFKPDHYVIADFNGYHYKLITYKGRKILKLSEIPNKLKNDIISKCCEDKDGRGPYSIIEGFKSDKKSPTKISESEVVESIHQNLYDDSTIFQFYGKSSNKDFPGKGSGETSKKESSAIYGDLKKIKDWRRMLSDDWNTKFAVDKHEWKSVNHCVEGMKYKNEKNMEMYEMFSLNSGSELSGDTSLISDNQSNSGPISDEVYEIILTSKFSQNEELKTVLLKTHNALLMRYVKGKPPIKADILMSVRKKLQR